MNDIIYLLNSQGYSPTLKFLIVILALLIMATIFVLKGFSLWYSAKHNNKAWFIAILLLNTMGVLEIIYLSFFEKDKALKKYVNSKLNLKNNSND